MKEYMMAILNQNREPTIKELTQMYSLFQESEAPNSPKPNHVSNSLLKFDLLS